MLGKCTTTIVPYQEKVARKKEIEKQTEIMASECAQKHLIDQKTTNLNIRLVDKKQILTSSLI